MTRSSDRRAARRPAAATPRKVVRSTVAALVSAPGAAYRTAAAVALAALIGGAPVHAETPRLGPDVFEPDFIASAWGIEKPMEDETATP